VSILSDRDIAKALGHGSIRISAPGTEAEDWERESWRIQPASFEMTLSGRQNSLLGYGREMFEYRNGRPKSVVIVDPEDPPKMVRREWLLQEPSGRSYYVLQPGEFLLASLAERLTLVDACLCASIEGKSSLGRLGLAVHCTARYIDPGWDGELTLEFSNHSPRPIRLWAGMRVAQVRFERLSSAPERLYGTEDLGSHYGGSLGTVQAASVKPSEPAETTEAAETIVGWLRSGKAVPAGRDRFV
jgi:dCTP deaminase